MKLNILLTNVVDRNNPFISSCTLFEKKKGTENFIKMLETGQKAPEFSLYDSEKKKHALKDYNGQPVLILFFPLAFTSTCTKELCSVRDDISRYNQMQVQVLGISVDSLYTLARYKEDQHLNFPLLSDFNKSVSTAYDCVYKVFGFEMQGVSKRAAFVIDKTGVLRYVEVLENAGDLPDFKKINNELAKLNEFQQLTDF